MTLNSSKRWCLLDCSRSFVFACFILKLNRTNSVWCAWRGERILRSLEEVWQTGLEGAGPALHWHGKKRISLWLLCVLRGDTYKRPAPSQKRSRNEVRHPRFTVKVESVIWVSPTIEWYEKTRKSIQRSSVITYELYLSPNKKISTIINLRMRFEQIGFVLWRLPPQRQWETCENISTIAPIGAKIGWDIRPRTLSVPRSEQFSESLARGKLCASRNR